MAGRAWYRPRWRRRSRRRPTQTPRDARRARSGSWHQRTSRFRQPGASGRDGLEEVARASDQLRAGRVELRPRRHRSLLIVLVHASSTAVQNSWILCRIDARSSWTSPLTHPSARPYRRSCPKGPSGTGETEIASRASAPRRSLRALRCPDPVASAIPVRPTTARRTVIGIPVSVRPSGPFRSGPRPSSPWTRSRRPARP
jgi:hypothetical protein